MQRVEHHKFYDKLAKNNDLIDLDRKKTIQNR